MKHFSIILTVMVTALIGRATEPQTGWFFDQSTLQSFYLFDAITIDGLVVEGDGSGEGDGECYSSGNCDVVGAFRRGICDDPGYQNSQQLCEIFSVWNTDEEICIGWRYADSNGATTVPLMGKEGAEGDNTFTYANPGESAYLKVYDSSNGSILDLSPSAELPGWDLNQIFTIDGTSTANNTFGCTDAAACNYDAGATGDDESCWSANDGCDCADGAGSEADCAGVCNGSSTEDDCGVCDGGNASMDCAGECDGSSSIDNCGVCDDNVSNDDASCTGCTNSDADNYVAGNSIDDGSCEFTVSAVDDLAATPGANRVYLTWSQPEDDFVNDDGNYSYDVYMDNSLHSNSSTAGTTIYDLTAEQQYSFYVISVHEYGSSEASNIVNETPTEPTGAPTWRLQLVAEIDSYDQFENSGNPDWLLSDDQNFLGAAADGSWGYDEDHDIPEPPVGPSNYISLFFDHPEWEDDGWAAHFTEDIVSDKDDFFSTNLTQWNGTVRSNVPGSASIAFSVDLGVVPLNYEMYVELDGNYTRIAHEGETMVEFYMDGSGQKDFSVFIGNIVPQAPDNLVATAHYNSITLDWDEDASDLSDIGNRYPATSYNVYRDDQPADPDGNNGYYAPGNGPDGCGGLLTDAVFGQSNSDYNDDAQLYASNECHHLGEDGDYVDDCAGDGDCCLESWIGDGFCDDEAQQWGCDLMCYDEDGGDCDEPESSPECDDCEYDFTAYGSECCDTAWDSFGIDCASLEADYNWDCSGCACPGDTEEPGCAEGQFDCGDGQCIPGGYFCDGSSEFCNAGWGADCSNGADEGLDTCGYEDECDTGGGDCVNDDSTTDVYNWTCTMNGSTCYGGYYDDDDFDECSQCCACEGSASCGGRDDEVSTKPMIYGDAAAKKASSQNASGRDDDFSGEGLLQESTYFYTVTGSNLAGESSYGHTVRLSGGAETYFAGRDSRDKATTDDNASPEVVLANVESSTTEPGQTNGTNIGEGHYEIPHNFSPDENRIIISDDGTASNDTDYPYGIDRYLWTLASSVNADSDGEFDDLENISGTETATVTFSVGNIHENGAKSYTWNLHVESDHPIRLDEDGSEDLSDSNNYNSCGEYFTEISTHSDDGQISVTIEEEPNTDPDASSALGLIRAADGVSVVTSDDYDESDFNDYDTAAQKWYEPHDNDGADNPADLYFSADESDDADGKCENDGDTECDHQSYAWSLTTGALAGFAYDDLNGNGQYDEGEPFTLAGGDEIYESADLGDYIAGGPAAIPFQGACGDCNDGEYTASAPVAGDGSYNYAGRDLHFQREDDVYILSMTVTDIYGDMDGTSLVIGVSDERNVGPTVGDLRTQETYYISYEKDTRQTQVGDEDCAADNLNAADQDNDDLYFTWDYAYNDAGTDGSALAYGDGDDDSEYTHMYQGGPALNDNGWKDIGYDLEEGDHTFSFTATDSYGADASSSTTISVRREPDAVPASVGVVYEDLKYVIVEVSDNNLAAFDADECYGDVYDGDLDNTRTIELSNDGNIIETFRQTDEGEWLADDPTAGESTFIQIDKWLEAETTYTYSVQSYNDDGELGAVGEGSFADATTGNRPTVVVDTPNGLEIASITDLYNVEFTTTDPQYISRIEVFYLRDGEAEEDGTDQAGAKVESDTGVNSDGTAAGDATSSFQISDDTGLEVNYNAKVRVEVHDVGNYDGGNSQSKSDDSDDPFTMAAHTLHTAFDAGWHLFGPALEIYSNELDLVEHLEGSNNMGNWGQDWVAYDVGGTYDGLTLNLGEGYYLAVADGATMEVRGNPVIGDPVSSGGDLSLDKGWNLIANPLVNKIAKGTLTINDGSGSGDLLFEDAVDAGWIAPTIYGWFENSYVSIDRLMPFGGYWVNTSRSLTVKVRPHAFDDDGSLTRKSEIAGQMIFKARDIAGDGSSDFITIGLAENAVDEFVYGEDEYDLPRQAYASMGGEFIDMKVSSNLMKDIKSAEYDEYQAWTISIESEKVDNDIELSWGDVSGFEDDIHLVINGEAINMHEENYIELSSMIEEVAIVVGNVDSYLNPVPEEFGLSAAYPNPFNPTTNLGLALNADGYVSMSVFNIRGQVVEVLVDRNMKAGYHNITWNSDGISSGMYFVRVETGANTAMQKLMLLK